MEQLGARRQVGGFNKAGMRQSDVTCLRWKLSLSLSLCLSVSLSLCVSLSVSLIVNMVTTTPSGNTVQIRLFFQNIL